MVAVDIEILVGCLGRMFESPVDSFGDGREESEVCLDLPFIENGEFVSFQVNAEESGFETPKEKISVLEFQHCIQLLSVDLPVEKSSSNDC